MKPITLADLIDLATGPLRSWQSVDRLAVALVSSGPVLHRGLVWELREDATVVGSRRRALEEFATFPGADGFPRIDPYRVPGDDVLSERWCIPMAGELPAPDDGGFRVVGSFGPIGIRRKEVSTWSRD